MKVFAERVKPRLEENNTRYTESIDSANKRRKISEKSEENSVDYLKEAFSLLDSDTEEEDGQL
jgi:hypothetical protein